MAKYSLAGMGIYWIKITVTEDLGCYAGTVEQILNVTGAAEPRFTEMQNSI